MGILVNAFNDMLSEIELRTAALEESERQFRSLADSVPQLAWMAEPNGYIFWYNQRWYDYTGETPESMAGWGWQSVHHPQSLAAVLKNWHDALARRERFEMVFPLRDKDGSYREFLTIALPVRDAHGTIVRWFGTNTDITDQRRSEETLHQTEKLAAVGRLAASIAHEINNPLEAVSNLIYLANRQPDRAQGYLTIAEQELDRIGEITKNTLGFYRDTTTPTWIAFPEIADSVLLLYDRKIRLKNIQIARQYDDHVQLFGFSGELRQILANLISNAVEASGAGGRLIVRASAVGTNGHARGIRVTIADDGRGIPQQQLKQIFEPFFTTKKDSGTGLGLWLTQTLVQKHQGHIHVKSRNQGAKTGTVFSVFLPNASS
jgi:PAS domain S-box-containing protein